MTKSTWPYLPESIRAQAHARFGSRPRPLSPGPGDGYLYHWIAEIPSAGYRGSLPCGQLIRRTKEV